MFFLRLSIWACLCLLSLPFSNARIAHRVAARLGLVRRDACVEDGAYTMVSNRDDKTAFCSKWNKSPNATVTTYFTPYSTTTNFLTTSTVTSLINERVWITTTVTSTQAVLIPKAKRAPEPTARAIMPRMSYLEQMGAIADKFMADPDATASDDVVSDEISSLSSACSCQKGLGPMFTETITKTEPVLTRTVAAFNLTTFSFTATTTVRTITTRDIVNTTIHTGPTSTSAPDSDLTSTTTSTSVTYVSPISLTSSSPLGFDYACPDGNATDQIVVHGAETYIYTVYCGSSFVGESAFYSADSSSHGDCLALCSEASEEARSPLCKGASFDGSSCSLYSQAAYGHLQNAAEIDSVILTVVQSNTNTTFANRTIGSSQSSHVIASITSGISLITPPPEVVDSATSTSGCSTWTYLNSTDSLSWSTHSCSWSNAWAHYWTQAATTVYYRQETIEENGNGSEAGAGNSGEGGASAGQAANGTTWISSTASAVSSAENGASSGGEGTGGAGNGAGGTAYTSTITTIVLSSTSIYVTSGFYSGGSASAEVGGGQIPNSGITTSSGGVAAGSGNGGSGGSGVGGPIAPYTSTITTIISGSTSVYTNTGGSNGASSSGSGVGGPISPYTSTVTTVSNASTIVVTLTGEFSGASSGATGEGGPLPAASSLSTFNTTIFFSGETAVITATSSKTSGASSDSTRGGGPIDTPFNASTVELASSVTAVDSFRSSGFSASGTDSGGLIPGNSTQAPSWSNVTSTTGFSLATSGASESEEANGGPLSHSVSRGSGGRSGSEALPVPSETVPGPAGYGPAWNYTSPTPSGISSSPESSSEVGPTTSFATTTELFSASSGVNASETGSGAPVSSSETWIGSHGSGGRIGSQAPSGPFGYYPTWNGTSPVPTGTGELLPTGWTSHHSNGTWSRSGTQKPRSGSASPPESASTPTESASTGIPPSSAVPAPSGNFSLPVLSATPSAESSSPYGNYPLPTPTATPSAESAPAYRNYSFPAPTAAPSSSQSIEIARSSWLGQLTSVPEDTSTESISSGFPSSMLNGSWTRSHRQGPRSGTAVPNSSFNFTGPYSSSSYCATMTVATLTVTKTLYNDCPGTCITQSVGPFPHSYGQGPPPSMAPMAPASKLSAASSPPQARLRKADESATPDQVSASCSSVGNQIYNGEFEIPSSHSASEPAVWGFATASVSDLIFIVYNTNMQHTSGGSQVGRVISSNKTAVGKIVQPLTLCPNTTYSFQGFTRQLRPLAECEATFSLNGTRIGVVAPGTSWGSGVSGAKNYTVGAAPEIDFTIDIRCPGAVSNPTKGTIDFDDLSLTRVF